VSAADEAQPDRTVTETIQAIALCRKAGWNYVVSHCLGNRGFAPGRRHDRDGPRPAQDWLGQPERTHRAHHCSLASVAKLARVRDDFSDFGDLSGPCLVPIVRGRGETDQGANRRHETIMGGRLRPTSLDWIPASRLPAISKWRESVTTKAPSGVASVAARVDHLSPREGSSPTASERFITRLRRCCETVPIVVKP
jgi:hypothetical protein